MEVPEIVKKERRRKKKPGGTSSDSDSSTSDLPTFSFGSPQLQGNSPPVEEASLKPDSAPNLPTLVEKETEKDSSSDYHQSAASDIAPQMEAMTMDLAGPSQLSEGIERITFESE